MKVNSSSWDEGGRARRERERERRSEKRVVIGEGVEVRERIVHLKIVGIYSRKEKKIGGILVLVGFFYYY